MFLDDLLKPDQPAFTRGFIISLVVLFITSILLLYFANLVFILLVSILFFALLLPLTAGLCAPLWVKFEDTVKTVQQKSPFNQDKTIELMDEKSNEITSSYFSDHSFYEKAFDTLKKSSEPDTEKSSEKDEGSTKNSEVKNNTTSYLFYPANTPRQKVSTRDEATEAIGKQNNHHLANVNYSKT